MATMKISIQSTRPLMMQSETLANPLSAVTKAHKAVAGKRKKSEDDYMWLLQSEWTASMYHDAKFGPYLPGLNIEACLFEGAKAFKLGKLSKQALSVMDDKVPLDYDGPRDVKTMYGDGGTPFVDVRGVNVSGRKVMRARPLFLRWGCAFTLGYMEDLIDAQDVRRIVEHAGRVVGIGTYRPRFGRFEVVA